MNVYIDDELLDFSISKHVLLSPRALFQSTLKFLVHDNNNPYIKRYDFLLTQTMTGVMVSSGDCTAWGAEHSLPSLKIITEIKR